MYVTQQITSESFTQDQSTKPIQDIWSTVFDFDFSAEDRLIKELTQYNTSKFQTLENIIKDELEYTRQQREFMENMSEPDYYIKTSFNPDEYRFDRYASQMQKYDIETLESIINIAQ